MYSYTKKANKIIIPLLSLMLFATSSYAKNAKHDIFESENTCLAKSIYYEARGEPELGKKAVAKIILNRKKHDKFPKSICKVVNEVSYVKGKKRCQFDFVCSGQKINNKGNSWDKAQKLSNLILTHQTSLPNFGPNVLFFKHVDVKRSFGKGYVYVSTIGKHKFFMKNV